MNKRLPDLSVMKHDMEAITTKDIWEKQKSKEPGAGSVEMGDCPKPHAPSPEVIDLPTFPDSVFENLPPFLQKVVARSDSNEDRDMMLLGSLVTVGSCLPNVFGIYGGKKVFSNLFLFISAQASAGKGNMVYCRQLVNPIHEALRGQTREEKKEYKTGMRQFDLLKWKEAALPKPEKPVEQMLFIPANNSASGVFQLLSENQGRGLIFETEGDTLTHAFKADGGHFSDGIRKGFQHEMISFHRRKDNEHVEIINPCISLVLSGTHRQVTFLIPDAEDGLFSRFIFYLMNLRPEWKDMLDENIEDMEEYFDALGQEFFHFYNTLCDQPDIRFSLTKEQHKEHTDFFIQLQDKYLALQGMHFMATIRRLGLIAFRLAMTLSALRMMDSGNFSQKLVCSDSDFQRVLSMIRVLVQHSSQVFSQLPAINNSVKLRDKKEQFLDQLPEKFDRPDYIDLAKSMSIQERTAERYITSFCNKGLIFREQMGTYTNLTITERKE